MSISDCDVESFLSGPIQSAVPTRWERKACESINSNVVNQSLNTTTIVPCKTPKRTNTSLSNVTNRCSSSKKKSSHRGYNDRFIPNRLSMNHHYTMNKMLNNSSNSNNNENTNPQTNLSTIPTPVINNPVDYQQYDQHLQHSLFNIDDINSKVLSFKHKAPKPSESHINTLRVLYTQNRDQLNSIQPKRNLRHISSNPERVLDAPELVDDYYLNLLDWSQYNQLAIALSNTVYLWDANTGSINTLYDINENDTDVTDVTAVSYMQDGTHLAIANGANQVQIWNMEYKRLIRSMNGHTARIGSLAWNQHLISSGSRDSSIIHHDVRVAQHITHTLLGHEQEICGLKWSNDGTQLASGGNDNLCMIWDAGQTQAKYTFQHASAAVKALAWCPFQKNLLATGAGTADRNIRFYNTQSGELVNSIDTQSQVCALQWSKTEKELLSAHGFSQNQISVWKYPSMVKIADLTGHTSRVLHTALSPDGTTVCSAAADETLRFWRVWEPKTTNTKRIAGGIMENGKMITTQRRGLMNMNIR